MSKVKHLSDYPNLIPSSSLLNEGTFNIGDLICNIYSTAVWPASQYDVESIKPEKFPAHHKFRKMIPII